MSLATAWLGVGFFFQGGIKAPLYGKGVLWICNTKQHCEMEYSTIIFVSQFAFAVFNIFGGQNHKKKQKKTKINQPAIAMYCTCPVQRNYLFATIQHPPVSMTIRVTDYPSVMITSPSSADVSFFMVLSMPPLLNVTLPS